MITLEDVLFNKNKCTENSQWFKYLKPLQFGITLSLYTSRLYSYISNIQTKIMINIDWFPFGMYILMFIFTVRSLKNMNYYRVVLY